MAFPKGLLVASQIALALALTLAPSDALANGEGTSAGGDEGAGETGGDPIDFSSAWFIAPLPNASFEQAPATLDAEIGVHQAVEDNQIASVELFVDDVSIGSMECASGCVFADIELQQGVRELRLETDIGYGTSTLVYVDEELPSSMNDCETSGGSAGDDGAADEGGGASCSVNGDQLPPWGYLLFPALLLVPAYRRKR